MMNATKGRPCELVLPELRSSEDGRLLAVGTATTALDIGELRWDDEAHTASVEATLRVEHVRYYPEPSCTDGELQAVALVERRLAEALS